MIGAGFLPINDPGQPWVAILYASAILIALGVILKAPGLVWNRLVKPAARAVVEVDTISQLARVAPDLILLSHMGPVLVEIAGQFKTDSGSSLRDVINRLEKTAKDNSEALVANARAMAEQSARDKTAKDEVVRVADEVEKARSTAAGEVSATAKGTAASLALAVEAVKNLAALDAETLQSILHLAQSSDATVTRIEETNPVTPVPRPQTAA